MGNFITPFYAALLGVMFIFFSLLVVRKRFQHRVGIGDGKIMDLQRTIRVHANFAEYVPMAIILLFALEVTVKSPMSIHVLGIILVLARVLHAMGLSKSEGPTKARFAGTALTWVMMIVTSGLILPLCAVKFF